MRITYSLTTAARLQLQSASLQPTPAASCPLGSSRTLHAFTRQLVSTLFSHLGWQHHPWAFLYTSGFVTQRSRGRYSGYCRCTGMALEWVGGTHLLSASDSETAIRASSSQCRPIANSGRYIFHCNITNEPSRILSYPFNTDRRCTRNKS